MSKTDLPKGWIYVTLKEISKKIVDGVHSTPKYVPKGVPFISVKEIKNGKISFENCKNISLQAHDELVKRCNPEYGDVILTKTGTVGKTAVVNVKRPFSLFVNAALIKLFQNYIDSQFIALWLEFHADNFVFQKYVKGGLLKNLTLGEINKIDVILPPLNEQIRIVSKLEEFFTKLDAGLEALSRTKMLLKQYRRSSLKYAFEGKLTEKWRKSCNEILPVSKAFGALGILRETSNFEEKLPQLPDSWGWTSIGDIEVFIGSGITPHGGKSIYVDKGIPFIRSQNVYPDGLYLDDIVYVTPALHEKMSRTHVKPYDVLLNITGASIGRSTFVPPRITPANVNQHVCIIRSKDYILPKFLSYWLNSPVLQDIIFTKNKGITRQGLNYSHLRALPLPLTNIGEQGKVIDEIDRIISILNVNDAVIDNILMNVEKLRQSILKMAFGGKLIPQNPNDEPAEMLLQRINKEKLKIEIEVNTSKRIKNNSTGKKKRLM